MDRRPQRPGSLYPTIGQNPYPTIDYERFAGGAAPGPSAPSPSSFSPSPFTSNGPSGGQPSSSSSSCPTLRVVIAEPYRIPPPVRAPPLPALVSGGGGPSGGGSSISFEYEKKLIAELESSGEAGAGPAAGSNGGLGLSDPYESALARYTEMGYTREEVAMALVIASSCSSSGGTSGGGGEEDAEQVVEAARQYRELASMGFKAEAVVGALVAHGGDLAAATEACLSAAS